MNETTKSGQERPQKLTFPILIKEGDSAESRSVTEETTLQTNAQSDKKGGSRRRTTKKRSASEQTQTSASERAQDGSARKQNSASEGAAAESKAPVGGKKKRTVKQAQQAQAPQPPQPQEGNQEPKEPKASKTPKAQKPRQAGETGETPSVKGKRGARKNDRPVKVMFFGGVGEIGKNTTALEYGDEIIVIDAGVTFPDEEMPGIDLVVPDVSYLAENKDKIKAILLTHGHEDHIGGLPYLLKEIKRNTPIYATKLTHMLAENKLREHRINDSVQKVVRPGDTVKLGNFFEVEFINVTHSIAGALALAIRTPHGVIYHSGDFKIDLTPVAGDPIDLASIARIGKEGVLLLLGESTNIERPGYTMSEKVVGTTLDHLFGENVGRRLIIATFASNVHRLQQIIDLAVKYHRKVALSGRSMLNVVDAAMQIGEIKIPEGVLIDVEKTKNLFDHELVILSTGSQGEPMSALTRMAAGDFNKVTVGENDTIIISASPIPGNEKMIYRVINQLYQRGAKVVYESLESIHVSGHACIEEHKILHKLLNPKFFIPVHGEYRHLKRHAMLARDLGMNESNILIPEIGSCIELTGDSIRYGEPFAGGVRLIDGMGLEDMSSSDVIKDRKRMSEEGLFIIEATISSGFLVGEVQVIRKGFFNFQNYSYDREIAEMVEHIVDSSPDLKSEELAASVKKSVKNFLYKKTKQSPLIVPVIVEI